MSNEESQISIPTGVALENELNDDTGVTPLMALTILKILRWLAAYALHATYTYQAASASLSTGSPDLIHYSSQQS
jgi:hypothetical protein